MNTFCRSRVRHIRRHLDTPPEFGCTTSRRNPQDTFDVHLFGHHRTQSPPETSSCTTIHSGTSTIEHSTTSLGLTHLHHFSDAPSHKKMRMRLGKAKISAQARRECLQASTTVGCFFLSLLAAATFGTSGEFKVTSAIDTSMRKTDK